MSCFSTVMSRCPGVTHGRDRPFSPALHDAFPRVSAPLDVPRLPNLSICLSLGPFRNDRGCWRSPSSETGSRVMRIQHTQWFCSPPAVNLSVVSNFA